MNKQVCVELPLGVTCRELIDEHAGGVWKGRKAKAAVPGGISMGLLSADELDTPLDFESLRKPGCLGLGTAAVTVIDDQTSIVDYLYNTCRFFAHESCGQCTPCREGTTWFYKTMKRIKAGGGRLEDLDILLKLANNMGIMPGTTICGLADGAAWPIKNAHGQVSRRARRVHPDAPVAGSTRSRRSRKKIAHGHPADVDQRCRCRCCQLPADLRSTSGRRSRPPSSLEPQRSRRNADGDHHHQRPANTRIPEGEKLNAIQMAQRVGVDIPYYCWHPALSVVANCRMCEIEVGTKDPKTGEIKLLPKLVPGCQTPAKDGTVLVTDSPKVKEHQRMIMEYLLLNHPLDCPVCDQAGECGLQDYSYRLRPVGPSLRRGADRQPAQGRFRPDPAQHGPLHHVHALRPVHPRDLPDRRAPGDAPGQPRRDRHLPRPAGRQPAGRQRRRPLPGRRPARQGLPAQAARLVPLQARLDLHRAARPAATSAPRKTAAQLWRFKPRHNPLVNDYWICDEGRYSYKAANDPDLLAAMYVRKNNDLQPVADRRGPQGRRPAASRRSPSAAAMIAGVLSPFLTVEEAYLAGSLPQGTEPGERAGARAGADARDRPDLPARPDQGADRRHQLRRAPAVHDPRREVPEPARRGGDPRAFRGEGDRLTTS